MGAQQISRLAVGNFRSEIGNVYSLRFTLVLFQHGRVVIRIIVGKYAVRAMQGPTEEMTDVNFARKKNIAFVLCPCKGPEGPQEDWRNIYKKSRPIDIVIGQTGKPIPIFYLI